MIKPTEWLRDELPNWVTDGVITSAQAKQIAARYPAQASVGWARLILMALGAVFVGLGVILFFAYNWALIPKFVKLALVFVAVGGVHGAALWFGRRGDEYAGLCEGLHALGTMLFGAGIWLVAQIYHIDEHYPNAFLYWSLGAVALAWAMPSLVQAFLALFLISFWSGTELFDFANANHGGAPLVLLGVLPLAWQRRSPMLLYFTVLVLILVTLFAAFPSQEELGLVVAYFMGAAAVAIAALAGRTGFPEAAAPLRRVGLFACLAVAYFLSFPDLVDDLSDLKFDRPAVVSYFAITLGTLVLATAALWQKGVGHLARHDLLQLVMVGAGALLVIVSSGQILPLGGWLGAAPFNLLLLGMAWSFIAEGSDALRPRLVSAGCLVVALVAVTRYADLFDSLLARAGVFVLLGVGIFAVGNFYQRNKRARQEAQA